MPSRPIKLSFSLLLSLAAAAAAAAPPSRLAAAVDARSSARLSGSVRPLAQARYDRGRLDGDTVLHGASIDLRLSPAQEAELDELLRQQQDPLSPNYHAWLTPQQYGERFGLSVPDLAKVEAWLRGQGLSVDGADSGGTHIRFSGSVARLEAAFQTELHRYRVGGDDHFANAMELSVPAALSGMVLGVHGLDDFRPRPRLRQVPAFTSNLTGNTFLSPGDVATIYNINPLYATATGSGRKIAVVGQTAINVGDIRAFRSAAGLPARDPVLMLAPGTGASQTRNGSDDMTESDIDVEWTGGIARDATIVFVYSGNAAGVTVFDALHYAITSNLAPVISVSYGNCEANNASIIDTTEQWLRNANAQGQTIVASSGDSGASDCDVAGSSQGSGPAVDYPASSPEVTGVGGTTFDEGGNTSFYWSGGKGSGADVISSAKLYIPEVAWNDTGMASGSSGTMGLSASGGGRSSHFTKPGWQTGAGVPGDNARYVPDVAAAADPLHDGYLYCTTNSSGHGTCVNGFRDNDSATSLTVAGGTSFSSPVFAGILTLVADKAGQAGLGNANPRLYQLAAGSPSPFHDIVGGDNKVPTSSGTIGYSAGPGYDPVTGLGSVDVTALADAWGAGSGSSSSSSGGSGSSSSGASGSGSASSSSGSSSGGGGGGGAWMPLPLLLFAALGLAGRRRRR